MATQNSYNLNFKDFRAKKKAELEAARKKAKDDRDALKKKRKDDQKALKEQTETVKNNSDQPKGLAKFTPIILEKGSHIAMGMTPVLLTLAKDLFPNENDIDLCPSKAVCERSLNQLNGIIDDLNQTSEFLTKITGIAGATATGLATIQTVSSALKYSIPIVSTAAKFSPLIPGIVVSALDDLDWINNNLLYKNDGTPRLPGVIAGVAGITAATGIVSFAIKNVVTVIETLKAKLEKCCPEDEINTLSPNTLEFSKLGNNDFEEQDPITYNGFIIRIEETPFTPTVLRYQAVGYNTYGVPLIKGPLSFSSNSLVLTNELKFIIDRDNLKAY
jgi:hypothetical protein